jgi:hypothetical protein
MVVRIVLAEDNDTVRHLLKSLLEAQLGWNVVAEVRDGRSAIETTRELNPDIVILDFDLPGLNGIDATREIVKELPDMRILVLTVRLRVVGAPGVECGRAVLPAQVGSHAPPDACRGIDDCVIGRFWPGLVAAGSQRSVRTAVNSENRLRSMFPPLTTHTIFPLPALPESPAATPHAAAPSQIMWFRAATIDIARRASSSDTTIDPASTLRESSHIPGNTDFPPAPSTQLAFQSGNFCAEPCANDK